MVWAAVLAVSCTKRNDTPFGTTGEAEVRLSVGLDLTENEQSITKADAPVLVPEQDLAIYVMNTHEDTLARYASFNDMPKTLKFMPGAYKVVAEYKPEGTKLPAFDTYVYRAEEKFVIAAGDVLDISLLAKLATAKISVEFDENFSFYYTDYSVDIRTTGPDSLRFAKNESRSGFFEPGSVRMRFNLTTDKGETLTFSPEPLAKADAADWYKLKLKVSSDQGTSQVIVIGTSDELNPEQDITVEIPRYFLPKDKPSITTNNFTSGVSRSVFEGEVPKWSVSAKVPGGVYSFILRMNDGVSGVLGTKLGGVDVVDLAALPKDDPMREKLKAAGFVWSAGLNSPEDAAAATDVWLDFTNAMVAQEDGATATYDFNIELTDSYNQNPEVDYPCVVKAEIKSPNVTFSEITAGNIWSTRAFFTLKANYDMMNGVHPTLQYRKTSSSDWNNAVEGADVTLTALDGGAPGSDGLYTVQYVLNGLQAATEYEFQVVSNGKTFRPSQATWTTEEMLSVPGLVDGGFGGGWDPEASTTALGVTVQAPPTGWATRNVLTTSQRALSVNPDTGSGTIPASDVSANNGAVLVINPGNYLRRAVQLTTIGWGQGTYSNSTVEYPGDPSGVWGNPWLIADPGAVNQGSVVRNTSAAILYLGSYAFDPASLTQQTEVYEWYKYNRTILGQKWCDFTKTNFPYEQYNGGEAVSETGAPFASRPSTLTFQYMFTPSKEGSDKAFLIKLGVYSEDGEQIGGVSWSDGTAVSAMTTRTLDIDYTNTSKRAATLKLFFSSDVRWENVGIPNGGPDYAVTTDGTPHIGNVLLIDNVQLGYDFE